MTLMILTINALTFTLKPLTNNYFTIHVQHSKHRTYLIKKIHKIKFKLVIQKQQQYDRATLLENLTVFSKRLEMYEVNIWKMSFWNLSLVVQSITLITLTTHRWRNTQSKVHTHTQTSQYINK